MRPRKGPHGSHDWKWPDRKPVDADTRVSRLAQIFRCGPQCARKIRYYLGMNIELEVGTSFPTGAKCELHWLVTNLFMDDQGQSRYVGFRIRSARIWSKPRRLPNYWYHASKSKLKGFGMGTVDIYRRYLGSTSKTEHNEQWFLFSRTAFLIMQVSN